MSIVDDFELEFDPDKIDEFYQRASEYSGRDRSTRFKLAHRGPDALEKLTETVGPAGTSVLIVQDDTPMTRNGRTLKPLVKQMLEDAGDSVRVLELTDPHGVHGDMKHVQTVADDYRDGEVVVALGSGSIVDISKHALFTLESQGVSPIRLVSIPTANSVGAYTSEMAVITANGVKRTRPSRLPDALVLDTTILRDTPEPIALGGVGDSGVVATSMAEYRLAHLCGVGKWEPLSKAVMWPARRAFLDKSPATAGPGITRASAMADSLTGGGLGMTFAAESAPASGLEHVTSHMLDMRATASGAPIRNHGLQCGLATTLVALAYEHLLEQCTADQLRPQPIDWDTERAHVDAVFREIDPSGMIGGECWSDYSEKCRNWESNVDRVNAVLDDWDATKEDLRKLLPSSPKEYLEALAYTGHPIRFADIDDGIPADDVRWAFRNARFMRKRVSVADLLGFAGLWTDELADDLLTKFTTMVDEL